MVEADQHIPCSEDFFFPVAVSKNPRQALSSRSPPAWPGLHPPPSGRVGKGKVGCHAQSCRCTPCARAALPAPAAGGSAAEPRLGSARTRTAGSAKTRWLLSACAVIFYGDSCCPTLSRGFLAAFPPGRAGAEAGAATDRCLALGVTPRFPTTSFFSTGGRPSSPLAITKAHCSLTARLNSELNWQSRRTDKKQSHSDSSAV